MDGDVCGGGGVQVQTCRSVHKPSHDNVINMVMEMNPKYVLGEAKKGKVREGSTGEELELRG